MNANDIRATPGLLEQLEAHLPLEKVVLLLETIAGETLVSPVVRSRAVK